MPFDALRSTVTRRPVLVIAGWAVLAGAVGLLAPDLSRLAAEGQARLLPESSESLHAKQLVAAAWPDQAYDSIAVLGLHRPGGLTDADRAHARRLSEAFGAADRPAEVLRVLGPDSQAEVAARLVSPDGTVQLVMVPLADAFVAPGAIEAVAWLQERADAIPPPAGLRRLWSGDAVVGSHYMGGVQASLDRAAVATVLLLMVVLLVVYRSFWLAMVPMATIGVSLVVSRGILGWMAAAGWEISPLVELFLVAVLFGCGTDFCLFISWRFSEHWNPASPGASMRVTLRRAALALLTSGGTTAIGISLMGTTQFKLFSSTGPSVAIGLILTLAAALTLTPALLVVLARIRPRAFAGMARPSSGFWDFVARVAMRRPAVSWAAALALMTPLALVGIFEPAFVQDTITELPASSDAVRDLRFLSEKFGPGATAPLSVVLRSESDLRESTGLALIDDLSRVLDGDRGITEVRSATQPLGSPEPLERARIAARLEAVGSGLGQIDAGAARLERGLNEGAAKLRATIWLEEVTGLRLTGGASPGNPRSASKPTSATASMASELARQLTTAAEGAAQIEAGTKQARDQIETILKDPVGRRALDRLLIDAGTRRDFPQIDQAIAAYVSDDGRFARLDLVQADRPFSAGAMDGVVALRSRLADLLDRRDGPPVTALVAGPNAESADIRALTRSDQVQSWFLIPAGVFVVLLVALRDPKACVNLVATMLLTYAFALGATELLFVRMLGAEGLDWKVPYFLFVLLVAVGVDYNVFLMARLREESEARGLRSGIVRAIAQTGGLISSAAAITACSFASFLTSPLGSLRQLGFALAVGITVDAIVVRPILVPCGHWLWHKAGAARRPPKPLALAAPERGPLAVVPD